ncbi:MAG: ATP-binding cassette domain-containing protein [Chloroflexi bacterium]|nr:ATP-binding cassette domain-containing protein [Chloroflexota bacterium]
MADGYLVQVTDLHYTYPDGTAALNGVTLALGAGEKVALIGPNGAGKSTLLLHLNGIYRGRGTVRVAGMEVNEESVRRIRARVGLVFQNPDDQLFSPTVFDDVAFGPLYMGLEEDEIRRRVERALRQVGMWSYADRMPHHLSLGEKKRVAIATVLSMSPEILALDEPSAGLDPQARRALIELLVELPQAMLIASHDLDFVRRVCRRAILLVGGRVVSEFADEQMDDLFQVKLW